MAQRGYILVPFVHYQVKCMGVLEMKKRITNVDVVLSVPRVNMSALQGQATSVLANARSWGVKILFVDGILLNVFCVDAQ